MVGDTFTGVGKAIRDMSPGIVSATKGLLTLASQPELFDAMSSSVNRFGTAFEQSVTRLVGDGTMQKAFTGLGDVVGSTGEAFVSLVENGIKVFAGAAPGVSSFLKDMTGAFNQVNWEQVGASAGAVFDGIGKAFAAVPKSTWDAFGNAFQHFGEIFQDPQIQQSITDTINALPTGIEALNRTVKQTITVVTEVVQAAEPIVEAYNKVDNAIEQAHKKTEDFGTALHDAIGRAQDQSGAPPSVATQDVGIDIRPIFKWLQTTDVPEPPSPPSVAPEDVGIDITPLFKWLQTTDVPEPPHPPSVAPEDVGIDITPLFKWLQTTDVPEPPHPPSVAPQDVGIDITPLFKWLQTNDIPQPPSPPSVAPQDVGIDITPLFRWLQGADVPAPPSPPSVAPQDVGIDITPLWQWLTGSAPPTPPAPPPPPPQDVPVPINPVPQLGQMGPVQFASLQIPSPPAQTVPVTINYQPQPQPMPTPEPPQVAAVSTEQTVTVVQVAQVTPPPTPSAPTISSVSTTQTVYIRQVAVTTPVSGGGVVGVAGGGVVGYAAGGIASFPAGGVLPGYQPGRDTVPAILSRGEAVLVPELVKQLGPENIVRANYAASHRQPAALPMAAGGLTQAQLAVRQAMRPTPATGTQIGRAHV